MRATVKLGRIAGIPLGLHWSVLVITGLITQTLAVSVLPAAAPGRPVATYWSVAIVSVAVFLAALLAHEYAYAITARHFGLHVRRITLWLLGGVAELDGRTPNAHADLMIAAAGPLTSLGTAVVFGGLAVAASASGTTDLAISALVWLALVNLVLAVFNLLPGAPLDGGRVLAAIVWWRTGNRAAAQQVATRAGAVLGTLLIGGGVVEIFLTSTLDGLWLALLGWFLLNAARAEGLDAAWQSQLDGMQAQDAMTAPPVSGYAHHTVDFFINDIARYHPHHSYPVLGLDGLLTGMVTLTRITAITPSARTVVRLGAIQTPRDRTVIVAPDTPLAEVAQSLHNTGQQLATVCTDGHVCGVLSLSDIIHAIELAALDSRPARHRGYADVRH